MNEIQKSIQNLKILISSRDAHLVPEYITKLPEFSDIPPHVHVARHTLCLDLLTKNNLAI